MLAVGFERPAHGRRPAEEAIPGGCVDDGDEGTVGHILVREGPAFEEPEVEHPPVLGVRAADEQLDPAASLERVDLFGLLVMASRSTPGRSLA